jgi:glycosyltransferase involved in cell wall biosynthesis
MEKPKVVTVITPTWQRHEYLFDRCIPSVMNQTYAYTEHIVVSDGPDPELRMLIKNYVPQLTHVRYFELAEHPEHRHWGIPARSLALDKATGDYITYCDDDDALRPNHCELAAQSLLENPDCGLTISRMVSHNPGGEFIIGWGPPTEGNVGTPMLTHRRELLDVASWGYDSATEDYDLVKSWLEADVKFARVDAETIDVWPSAYR